MRADQGLGAGWEVSGGAGRPHKAWEGDGQCLEITEVLFVREGVGRKAQRGERAPAPAVIIGGW